MPRYVRETKVPLTEDIDRFLKETNKPIIHILREYKQMYELLHGKIPQTITELKKLSETIEEHKKMAIELKALLESVKFWTKSYEVNARTLWKELMGVLEKINRKTAEFGGYIDNIKQETKKIEKYWKEREKILEDTVIMDLIRFIFENLTFLAETEENIERKKKLSRVKSKFVDLMALLLGNKVFEELGFEKLSEKNEEDKSEVVISVSQAQR